MFMKAHNKTYWKKKAWQQFSLFIRLRGASLTGEVECYTCGKIMNYKDSQAGHGVGGRNNAVLFEEALVRCQCVGCNLYGRGKYSIFTQKLIEEYGAEKYYELVKKSNEIVQYKASDYEMIYEKYKSKLEQLSNKEL